MACGEERKMNNRNKYFDINNVTNRNATIKVREDKNGKVRTETRNRDAGTTQFAVSTNPKTNSTSLYVDLPHDSFSLSGSEARTLYRLLQKHYSSIGKSV